MMATDERPLVDEVAELANALHAVADRLVATVERVEQLDPDDEETPSDEHDARA